MSRTKKAVDQVELLDVEVTRCQCETCPGPGWDPARSWAWDVTRTRTPEAKRNVIEQASTGRKRRFCSDACKTADYKARRAVRERDEQRRADELAAERRFAQDESVVMHALANVKMSTTVRKATAEAIVRQLRLANRLS